MLCDYSDDIYNHPFFTIENILFNSNDADAPPKVRAFYAIITHHTLCIVFTIIYIRLVILARVMT